MAGILMRSRSGDSRRLDRGARRRRRRVAALALLGCLASLVALDATTAVAAPTTIDGQFSMIGPIGQGGSLELTVVGRGGVPATGVGAVALNVTATNPTANSYLTVWPTGSAQPLASNLNFGIGQTVPNMVIVPVGINGQISIYNNAGGVDVIVDVLGWFPTAESYTGLTPARLMDTRPGVPTIDGQAAGIGAIGPNASTNLTVVNRGGVPGTGVGAVALNVTATNPTANSYLTVWPAGSGQPLASNLNFGIGQTVPNMVIVPVGADGQISIYNNTGTVDVIVDVLGWFPTGDSYTGLTPARLMDTRPGVPTIDGQAAGIGAIGPNVATNLTVVNRGGVPATGVGAVALNVTAANPTGNSYLTVWPAGAAQPLASNLNFGIGRTVPNMVIVPVGADGQISIYNNTGTVDVIVDVLGWFPTGDSYTGLTPARQMDTRIPAPLPAAGIGPSRNLLVVRPALHQMAGADRIAVWVCDVPIDTVNPGYSFGGPERLAIEPQTVARWAQQNAGIYFDGESNGRYIPTFVAMGHIPLAPTDGPSDCLRRAEQSSGRPFTNVLATDTSGRSDGFASPGLIYGSDSQNLNLFDQPPSETARGAWVGGGSVSLDAHPSPMVVTHELGHTLHWPHSFTGDNGTQYDNPTDVMSTTPDDGWCEKSIGNFTTEHWPCRPPNTLAFNRFAAGWIDESQVAVHGSGTSTTTLDAPTGAGVQMLAAIDPAQPSVMLTLEARPRLGNDQYIATEGVAAHIVDQRGGQCGRSQCVSTSRRHRQAISGTPYGYDHVLQAGSTTVINGLTITVTARVGNTFTVQMSGTFVPPPA